MTNIPLGRHDRRITQTQNHTRRALKNCLVVTALVLGLLGSTQFTVSAATLDAGTPVLAQRTVTTSLRQSDQTVVALTGFTQEWQTLNNCGPAVLSTLFSYYGVTLNQQTIAQTLRPNPNDQNVRPDEVAQFGLAQGFQALNRVNGSADLLRQFVANGIPVVIETWTSDVPGDIVNGFAHFRLVTGFDDARQAWIVYDPYLQQNLVNPQGSYQGMYVSYAEADQLWRITNRKYVLIYKSEQAATVQTILGDQVDDQAMWQAALTQARSEKEQWPDDAFSWFNFGSALQAVGLHAEAASAFQKAQELGLPIRMFWYQYEPLAAYSEAGRHQELIQLVDQTLQSTTGLEELYYWKAISLLALGGQDQAQRALNQALAIQPNYQPAQAALTAVNGG